VSFKGEIGFDADGQHYTLVYSFNALCVMEQRLGRSPIAWMEALKSSPENMLFTDLRTLFWSGLGDYHPALTEADAGTIMTHVGFEKAAALAVEALNAAFPQAASRPLPGLPQPRPPQRARAGKRS
jgi:hypothetical protein